jgi:[acyl-carrier-protein] S-malonyltransferase
MGRELARAHPVAAQTFEEADDVLGFGISRLSWEGPEEELVLTKNAQPAMLTHSTAVYRVVTDRLGDVAIAAGHSLGEFSAHVAAGTLGFSDAVRTVRLRGELMYSAGRDRPGTMAAVLGLDDDVLVSVCERASAEAGTCVPANFNSRGQIVISGDLAGIERAMELASDEGAKRVVQLSVSGAFHSPLMTPAEEGLRQHLEKTEFRDPAFPVVANVTAEPVTSAAGARDLLIRQLTSPVRWSASVGHMVESGVDEFLELGPGSVLRGLNRRNAKGIRCCSLGEPDDLDDWQGREG